jgi:hypothetical protein
MEVCCFKGNSAVQNVQRDGENIPCADVITLDVLKFCAVTFEATQLQMYSRQNYLGRVGF